MAYNYLKPKDDVPSGGGNSAPGGGDYSPYGPVIGTATGTATGDQPYDPGGYWTWPTNTWVNGGGGGGEGPTYTNPLPPQPPPTLETWNTSTPTSSGGGGGGKALSPQHLQILLGLLNPPKLPPQPPDPNALPGQLANQANLQTQMSQQQSPLGGNHNQLMQLLLSLLSGGR